MRLSVRSDSSVIFQLQGGAEKEGARLWAHRTAPRGPGLSTSRQPRPPRLALPTPPFSPCASSVPQVLLRSVRL